MRSTNSRSLSVLGETDAIVPRWRRSRSRSTTSSLRTMAAQSSQKAWWSVRSSLWRRTTSTSFANARGRPSKQSSFSTVVCASSAVSHCDSPLCPGKGRGGTAASSNLMAPDGKAWSAAVVGGCLSGSPVAFGTGSTGAPEALPRNHGSPHMLRAAHSKATSAASRGGGEGGGVRRGKTAVDMARMGDGKRAKACADATSMMRGNGLLRLCMLVVFVSNIHTNATIFF